MSAHETHALTRADLAEAARQLRAVLAAVEAGQLPAEGPKDRAIADRLRGALDVLDVLAGSVRPRDDECIRDRNADSTAT